MVGVARALVVVTSAVLLSACGGGPAGSAPSSTTSCLRGDAADDGVVGLSEADAVARVEALGLTSRVVGRGSECYVLTTDFLPDRVNLDLDDDGVVRGATRG